MNAHCLPIIDADLPDPFVLRVDGTYYLFATGQGADKRFIPIHRSTDLEHWTFLGGAVPRGDPGAWNGKNFWAPETILRDGQYHLYYTASPEGIAGNTGNRVGRAIADAPEGPYRDAGIVVQTPSIDGSPFCDEDGAWYLFYTREHSEPDEAPPGRILVDRLPEPGRVANEPRELVSRYEWQEGICLLRRHGRYFLFFSVGNWRNDTYHIRWAAGASPLGPFEESPEPLLTSNASLKGPGHHNFFRGPDDRDWMVFHAWDPAFKARRPHLAPLEWRDQRPVLA